MPDAEALWLGVAVAETVVDAGAALNEDGCDEEPGLSVKRDAGALEVLRLRR
jgi:hypothetical protein